MDFSDNEDSANINNDHNYAINHSNNIEIVPVNNAEDSSEDDCVIKYHAIVVFRTLKQDEFGGDGGVDLYDDVITNSSGRRDSESGEPGASESPSASASTPNNVSAKTNSTADHREGIHPLRKHQVYIGNLTWVRGKH